MLPPKHTLHRLPRALVLVGGRTPRNLARGVTLLELLIVVCLTAIVLGLLVSAAGKARQAADAASCANHLKQIGLALHSYLNDHNGQFPPSREQNYFTPGGETTQYGYVEFFFRPYIPYNPAILDQPGATHKDAGVYWCPGDRERSIRMADRSYGYNYKLGGNDALPNVWNTQQPNPNYHAALASIKAVRSPGQIIYSMDHMQAGGQFTTQNGGIDNRSWPLTPGSAASGPSAAQSKRVEFKRHGEGANALFLDGSVRKLQFEELKGTDLKHIIPAS